MQKKKLLDVVHDKMRMKHYSISTERTYAYWIKYFILFHNKKHPIEMAKPEIEQFLTFLAVQKKVSLKIKLLPLSCFFIKKFWV